MRRAEHAALAQSAAAIAQAVRSEALQPGPLLAAARDCTTAWESWLGAVVHSLDHIGAARGPLAGVVAGVKDCRARHSPRAASPRRRATRVRPSAWPAGLPAGPQRRRPPASSS